MILSDQHSDTPEAEATSGVAPASLCSACSSGQLAPDRVKSAFWEGDRLVAIENIPALVCTTCGEQYLDDITALALDLMRGSGFPADQAERDMNVQVFAYRQPGEGDV